MAKPKRPGVPSTAPAAPATAKVPAPTPVKPAGGAAAGGAAPRKAAPSGGAPRNVPPPPPREEEDMFAGSSITLEPDEAEVQARTREKISTWLGSTPEERARIAKERETATLSPYLERLQRVGDLKAAGKIGVKSALSGAYTVQGAGKGGAAGPTQVSARFVQAPSREDLAIPVVGARTAKQLAEQYRQAVGEYDRQRLVTEAAKNDPYTDRRDLASYAADTRAKLQRVADLRASLRQYGWLDEDLKTLE